MWVIRERAQKFRGVLFDLFGGFLGLFSGRGWAFWGSSEGAAPPCPLAPPVLMYGVGTYGLKTDIFLKILMSAKRTK